MAVAREQSRQYFIGIAGAQTGPFTDVQVVEKIQRGEIPDDALVWFEGLGEWQPIGTIAFFKEAYEGTAAVPLEAAKPKPKAKTIGTSAGTPVAKKTSGTSAGVKTGGKTGTKPKKKKEEVKEVKIDALVSFGDGGDAEPVFGEGGGVFEDEGANQKRKMLVYIAVGIAVIGLGAYVAPMIFDGSDDGSGAKTARRADPLEMRKLAVSHARSEILVKPQESIDALRHLVQENQTDGPAKEAIDALLDYFKFKQQTTEGAQFLASIGRHAEAAKWFLLAPAPADAEKAYYAAFQKATDPAERKTYLLESIKLALAPIQDLRLVVERVHEYEKTFPGDAHPYGYYLKTPDEKIADLFTRIAPLIMRSLTAFIAGELPEVKLRKNPTLEIAHSPTTPRQYRLQATYRGDIQLSYDRLKGIFIDFWWVGQSWYIVDSNITVERQKWARRQRKRLDNQRMSSEEMLEFLENIFRTEYPKNQVHETASTLPPRADR